MKEAKKDTIKEFIAKTNEFFGKSRGMAIEILAKDESTRTEQEQVFIEAYLELISWGKESGYTHK